jgi:hypothetical protein
MSATELLEPILKGGIRSVNFFNGRLLSAEDLSDEQAANRDGRRRLGQALGDGVAYGLEVAESPASTKQEPVVTVSPGLAVNRAGQALRLPAAADVSLVRQAGAAPPSPAATTFKDCHQLQPGTYIAGAGVYLLTVAPAAGREGRAPVSGLGNVPATCNARYATEGVQFRLVRLVVPDSYLADPARLRNRLAYGLFGTGLGFANFSSGPQLASPSLLDGLPPRTLTEDDVPLAAVYWTSGGGLEFVDLWAVRRRVTRPSASERWALLIGDRRASESEAMFLQFEGQLQDIITKEAASTPTLVASQRFDFLPPAGLLPVGTGLAGAFNRTTFFGPRVTGTTPKSLRFLRSLLREAASHEPINLTGGDGVQLYTFLENSSLIAFASQPLADRFITDPPLGGDLSGTASAASVQRIRGVPVSGVAPQDGEVLMFSAQSGGYVPATVEAGAPAQAPPVNIATGLVTLSQFSLANVPGGVATKDNNEPRATAAITHGLGPVPVAIIIGLDDNGDNPGPPNFERTVDRYYAFRDTGVSTFAYHVVAEVTRPYNGQFKLFTNVGTMQFFDRLRWWAVKLPS